jgi:phosphatidylserine/phosphatidylglycerophosphate/cardiolipin synthase-like enzyme
LTVLEPGKTCWRIERSNRVATLVDNDAYYPALYSALCAAEHSILILGWAFDPRTRLAPDGSEGPDDPDEIGRILIELSRAKPELDVRILVWNAPLGLNGRPDIRGHRAKRLFAKTSVVFRQADDAPVGACHHQKIVVIDKKLAFCGGGDIVTNRWDTQAHLHMDPRRILPDHARHSARHEVMILVEDAAAVALGELFVERWASVDDLEFRDHASTGKDLWPEGVPVLLCGAQVGIARSLPAWRGRPSVDETRQLTIACIRAADRTIYLENQYFACREVATALAERLGERDGPEVVLILNQRAPSWFDRLTMDFARNPLIRALRAADRYGRFRALSPRTSGGAKIVVHAKVSVFDDQILRVGSANLNNRSQGFDTECDLAVEGRDAKAREAISGLRDQLLSHYLGVTAGQFTEARIALGGVVAAIDSLKQPSRLVPLTIGKPTWWEDFAASRNLGDPRNADENWRLRRRRP